MADEHPEVTDERKAQAEASPLDGARGNCDDALSMP